MGEVDLLFITPKILLMNKLCFAFTLLGLSFIAYGQEAIWIEQMRDPSVNFYTVQKSFEKYWENREIEKGKGYKQFKRWETFMEPRVFPDGVRPNPSVLATAFLSSPLTANAGLGDWKPRGPYIGSAMGGIGRINRVTFNPNDPNIIWAATASGGIWKSDDGGISWATNTDFLENLGVSDIEIDPVNHDIMYVATGDRNGSDTYSFGVLKSTDGGVTWNPTGLSRTVSQQFRIADIYINPDNTSILLVATDDGIYRSVNAGSSWVRVRSGSFNSIVQKVGNPNILFCTSRTFNNSRIWRSTDNGSTWGIIASNFPVAAASRIELAVTEADSNYVYALAGASSDQGFEGLYRSTDGGDTWTQQANTPNLLGWTSNGSDGGGQAWYDLALAVDPDDRDHLFVGGVNVWESTNGGTNWSIAGHWTGSGAPYIHADTHGLIFSPHNSLLYASTDGGLYRLNATQNNWDPLNDGMNITQYYRLGTTPADTALIIAGSQDNGTHLLSDQPWDRVIGGDGMECAISSKNPNIMYGETQFGNIRKSTNGGASFSWLTSLPPNGNGNWNTSYILDPKHPDTLYACYNNLWRSFNGGATFTASALSMSPGDNIDHIAISPNQTNVLYISSGDLFWKSTDRGTTWSNRSANIPGGRAITYIAVGYDSPDHVIITKSGYTATDKVYESFDGGLSWTDLSSGLPNLPVNTVVIENNGIGSIYIGTDVGVYYRDTRTNGWVSFNAGLPNVIVSEMEINYAKRKLMAATYGRGIYESPLYTDLVAPEADFTISNNICLGDTVTFNNTSSFNPDTYNWTIQPASFNFVNGTNANSENPAVVFNQSGFYDVKLKVGNALGEDSIIKLGALAVDGRPLPFTEDFESPSSKYLWEGIGEGFIDVFTFMSGGNALMANIFGQPTLASYQSFTSPSLNFSGTDSVWLTFDYAYRTAAASSNDSIKIYLSTDCSSNWTLVAALGENSSQNFVTGPAFGGGTFVPAAASGSDWCGQPGYATCPLIDLSPWSGMKGVRLRFEIFNAAGNNIFIDNINISGNSTVAPTANFSALTSQCALKPVTFSDQSFGNPSGWEWTFTGGSPATSTARNPVVTYTTAGSYSVKLKVTNAQGTDSITKTSFVNIDPIDPVSISLNTAALPVCLTDTLRVNANTVNEGTSPLYNWYYNGAQWAITYDPFIDIAGFANGDEIFCILQSSESCAFPANAYSDTLVIATYPDIPLNITPLAPVCENGNPVSLSASPSGGSFSGIGVTGNSFDPSVAGDGIHLITYTYQGPNGCRFNEDISVEVEDLPLVTFVIPETFCESDGLQILSNVNPSGGSFAGPGITGLFFIAQNAGAGNHTIYYTYNAGSCGSITDSAIAVVHPNPPQPLINNNSGVLSSSVTAASYQWFLNNTVIPGATQQTYTPASGGTYRVEITDINGCTSRSVPFSLVIGLGELAAGFELEVYPNPAQNLITVKLRSAEVSPKKLMITNAVGVTVKVLDFGQVKELEREIDLSSLAAGAYILNFYDGSQVSRTSLIKY